MLSPLVVPATKGWNMPRAQMHGFQRARSGRMYLLRSTNVKMKEYHSLQFSGWKILSQLLPCMLSIATFFILPALERSAFTTTAQVPSSIKRGFTLFARLDRNQKKDLK
jgi:hypothetical protein